MLLVSYIHDLQTQTAAVTWDFSLQKLHYIPLFPVEMTRVRGEKIWMGIRAGASRPL